MPRALPRLILVYLALTFVALGVLVASGWTDALDEAVSLALQRGGTPWQGFYEAVSRPLDTWRGFVSALLVIVAALWLAGRRPALFVLIAGGGAVLLAHLAKLGFGRLRPAAPVEVLIAQPLTSSFPSGHVAWVAGFAGALAYLALRDASRERGALVALAFLGAVSLMGLSRLYLGQHFLTDVLGGALLGLLAVALASPLLRRGVSARRCESRRRCSVDAE